MNFLCCQIRQHVRVQRMRLLLIGLVLVFTYLSAPPASGVSSTVTVTPAAIPWSASDLVNRMRGYYRWYDAEPIPQPRASLDHYIRFSWRQLEPTLRRLRFLRD